MEGLNLDGLSLMAFSTSDIVAAWKESVRESERQRTQKVDVTAYTRIAHRDVYTRIAHVDTYSQTASRDSYSRTAHTNSYSNVAHTNSYTNRSGTTSYTQRYSQTAHRNYSRTYSKRTANYSRLVGIGTGYAAYRYTNYTRRSTRYTQSAHRNSYSNYYYRYAYRQSYSERAYRNSYSKRAHVDSYTRVAHVNRYTKTPESNTYDKITEYNKGFDHTNYIPSAPEVYNVEGKVITENLEIRMASYDANQDGLGTQDDASKDIYYTVKIRHVQDLLGNEINGNWITIQEGAMTEDLDLSLEPYTNGIYELSTQAYNLPRTENEVTKTYISDEKITTFTIVGNGINSDLTIFNAPEFMDYLYGLETYKTRNDTVKKYVDSIIYANSKNQKGLFVEIDLKEEDVDSYHTAKAGLLKNGTVIASGYDVVFETDENGKAIAGDKMGVVFIPINDMMDDGCFDDVVITVDVTEFSDQNLTTVKNAVERHWGVSEAADVVYIDIDNTAPVVNMTDPLVNQKVFAQNINITCTDVGSDIKESYYQVVQTGDEPKDDEWNRIENGHSTNFELNKKGVYDIYVKAIDAAGNETLTAKYGYHIYAKEMDLNVPKELYPGTKFDVLGEVYMDLKITKTEFWIQGYGETVEGVEVGREKVEDTERIEYLADLVMPSNVPIGQHIIFFKVYLEDGSSATLSKPVSVVQFSAEATDGPRYISGEFGTTVAPDSIWSTSARHRIALQKSMNNTLPDTYELKKSGSSE